MKRTAKKGEKLKAWMSRTPPPGFVWIPESGGVPAHWGLPRAAKTTVQARRASGVRGAGIAFAPGQTGRGLAQASRTVLAKILEAKNPQISSSAIESDRLALQVTEKGVVLTEQSPVSTSAGVMTGQAQATSEPVSVSPAQYSAVYTPPGPTLGTAIAAREAREDREAEAERQEEELKVPDITGLVTKAEKATGLSKDTMLIIGGAVAFWYFFLRD
jgi:hypothetical protein